VGEKTHKESYQEQMPISSVCLLCLGFSNAFVRISAVCSESRMLCMLSTLSLTSSLTQWWHNAMCLDHAWNWGLCVMDTDPSLSPLWSLGSFGENRARHIGFSTM
jgi:hypothetical protein